VNIERGLSELRDIRLAMTSGRELGRWFRRYRMNDAEIVAYLAAEHPDWNPAEIAEAVELLRSEATPSPDSPVPSPKEPSV
jgi:hypothetical protein